MKQIILAIVLLCMGSVVHAKPGLGGNAAIAPTSGSGGGASFNGGAVANTSTFYSSGTFLADVQPFGSTATFNATQTLDWQANGPRIVLVLTGNVTSSVWNNMAPKGTYELILQQDSTGSRTFTWPANMVWPNNGTAPALTTTANHFDFFLIQYLPNDGNFHILSEALNN